MMAKQARGMLRPIPSGAMAVGWVIIISIQITRIDVLIGTFWNPPANGEITDF
jgi:hypothetical protein